MGKRALGIRVIDFGPAGRSATGAGCCATSRASSPRSRCFLGYFWMLWDQEKQMWHDKIADTVVVPVDAYPVR